MSQALHHLCDLVGILPDYHDIWGNRHETSDETRRAMLSAMDIACGDEDEIAASIQAWHEAIWRRRLPPVIVEALDAPIDLTLYLPERVTAQPYEWRVQLEDGSSAQNGGFVPSELPHPEQRELDGEPWQACQLSLPAVAQTGYHQLQIAVAGETTSLPLIVYPPQCFQSPAIKNDSRAWGLAVQLYGVRSSRNWGIGDFTDLRHLIEWAARAGAGLVGVNPLHSLFPHNPLHISPYSPSSRQYVNVLYLDVEAAPEFAECGAAQEAVAAPEFQARLRALRATPLVEYKDMANAKFNILELLYQHFRQEHLDKNSDRAQAFRAYQKQGGEEIERFALYHALQAHLHCENNDHWGWPVWPAEYRDPASAKVKAFAEEQIERIELHQWLQWLTDEQLHSVGWRSLELGLGVGLYQDLAVGVDKGGAETWGHPHLYALEARVGCPPDEFNPKGQDWGLPPWIPHRLRDAGYGPYIRMLRANMRHAGALRMDHVMALMRLYWVPPGLPGDQGTYIRYPFRDLLGILALESQRNQCLVVGEDLGTVPDEVRSVLHDFGVLSYRLFYFERAHDGSFLPPPDFPEQALVAASTHDLPTLTGFWRGTDLDIRTALDLYPTEQLRENQIAGRAVDRARLLLALEREGLLPEGTSVHPVNVPEMTPAIIRAVHSYLARSPSKLALVQAEDMLGELEQANLPGTTDQHPNWRRKLSLNLEEWPDDPRISGLAEAMVAERGRAVNPHEPVPFPLRSVQAPRATYRLQLNKTFTFDQARELVPYLAELGISHAYCSPYLKARPGSMHGYDITDHGSVNPDIGDMPALEGFCTALAEHGMGHILDTVPNHMGIMGADNAWWLDVLENGEASAYAGHFDIDWNPVMRALRGKVLLPVLGDHYGNVLERGELKLAFDTEAGEFSLWYYQHRFPIGPRSYTHILNHRSDVLGSRLGENHPLYLEYQSLATGFGHLPGQDATEPKQKAERQRDKDIHKRHLAALQAQSPDIQQFIAENLDAFNGRVGEPASFDLLNSLIELQAYRLAFWRVASDEINYRRFFDINDLAALHMEHASVFEASHKLIFQLLQKGWLQGLRIDHADGLLLPSEYFERLQQLYREARPTARDSLYVLVEKILAPHERLRPDWAVSGTSGYEFINLVNGLFVDGDASDAMLTVYRQFTRERKTFEDILYQSKRTIMKTALASELNVLANRLSRIAEQDRHTRDYTLNHLRTALMQVTACFPVYRTYISRSLVTEEDRRHIEWACAVAKRRAGIADTSIYDFVRDVLTTRIAEGKNEAYRQGVVDFAMRYQQFSSPVMAKGMEDTAFYRYHPLASINEVGGEPTRFGASPFGFHRANQERARQHPHNLLGSSTHDSKRSEDVRARINVLSELPEEWSRLLTRWHRMNRARLGHFEGTMVPSRRDEYLLYQTLLGAWPDCTPTDPVFADFRQRINAYLIKAVRETKEWSSWLHPNPDYEEQLQRFVDTVLDPGQSGRFLQEFAEFAQAVAHFGRLNSLGQTLLKLTVPGVPDLYQGNEMWDYSLVDPDNRRPVDYALRCARLAELKQRENELGAEALCQQLMASAANGDIKLHLIAKTLQLRSQQPDLFAEGDYLPLSVEGGQAQHLIAFARIHEGQTCVVVVPRLSYTLLQGEQDWPLGEVWGDTTVHLPKTGQAWRNVFTEEGLAPERWEDGVLRLAVGKVLAGWPVGVLVNEETTAS